MIGDYKVLGVVITYKETEMTEKAICSLVDADVDVALVFNGWNENFRFWLDRNENYIDFKFLNKLNLGFCKGNNQALKLAVDKHYNKVFVYFNKNFLNHKLEIVSKILQN